MAEGDIFKKTTGPLGSSGSVFNADMGKPVSVKDNKNANTSSGFSAGLKNPNSIALTTSIPTNIDEVTLSSKYYPASQPFLVQFLIQFPASVGGSLENSVAKYVDSADNILEVRPNNLISFSCDEKPQGLGTFSLTLFDPKWNEIETKLRKSKGKLRIRWGYADQGDMVGLANRNTTATPWIEAYVFNYSLKFGLQGTTISLTGSLIGYSLTFTKKYEGYGANGELISDIVTKIAKDSGFQPIVEKTSAIATMSSLTDTNMLPKFFIKKGQTDLSFIMNELRPYAKSAISNEGDYQFFIKRPMKVGELPQLHFHTMHYNYANENSANSLTKIVIPTFTLFKDPNSPVIDYSPLWGATIANLIGANDNFSVIIDGASKDAIPYTPSIKTVAQPYDNKSGVTFLNAEEVDSNAKSQPDNKIISFETEVIPDLNHDEQVALLHTRMAKASRQILQANLTVQGIVAFQLMDLISVVVYIPQSTSKAHWTSGYFRINNIKHYIEAGSYKTVFHLVTDGRYAEGLEIMPVVNSTNG